MASGAGLRRECALNDDYHHCALVALTGRREALARIRGSAQADPACASAISSASGIRGRAAAWNGGARSPGTPSSPPRKPRPGCQLRIRQAAASGRPAGAPAVTALTLWDRRRRCSSRAGVRGIHAFSFADHAPELEGRWRRPAEVPGAVSEHRRSETQAALPPPATSARSSAASSIVGTRASPRSARAPHRSSQAAPEDPVIRRASPVRPGRGSARAGRVRPALLRRCGRRSAADREPGVDLDLCPVPEPLLAPPQNARWVLQWSSESPRTAVRGAARLHRCRAAPARSERGPASLLAGLIGDDQ